MAKEEPKWVVFDIDGVLCKKGTLLPIDAGVEIYKALSKTNPILILTFRPEEDREETLEWLNQWVDAEIGTDQLYMRIPDTDPGEYPSQEQKVDILTGMFENPQEEILVVFDDEAPNIKAFRDLGITAYQTLKS
jgi:phosphoglycolate phosphatase-like HAD superfamily hydrolase